MSECKNYGQRANKRKRNIQAIRKDLSTRCWKAACSDWLPSFSRKRAPATFPIGVFGRWDVTRKRGVKFTMFSIVDIRVCLSRIDVVKSMTLRLHCLSFTPLSNRIRRFDFDVALTRGLMSRYVDSDRFLEFLLLDVKGRPDIRTYQPLCNGLTSSTVRDAGTARVSEDPVKQPLWLESYMLKAYIICGTSDQGESMPSPKV
ncbi:hypothetical protein BDZ45DRAFT_746984 [Acephala macrosclerotiorum]|nr:hypothetical protein BDZ45DRAFT_746984 [Acephala macrosclerotiorum]